jgi:sugar phosphate isomerase/epimerase
MTDITRRAILQRGTLSVATVLSLNAIRRPLFGGSLKLDNVGCVLDSWHWYTAHETADDLRTLKNRDVVACDLNDAPAGIPVDQQIDNRRELPAATGVINLKKFLEVLVEIGYDGPIRAEPFNRVLNEMEDEMAVAATAMAMRNALALVGNRPA